MAEKQRKMVPNVGFLQRMLNSTMRSNARMAQHQGSPTSEIRKSSPSKVAYYQDRQEEPEAAITSACSNSGATLFYQDDNVRATPKAAAHAPEVVARSPNGGNNNPKDHEKVDDEVREEALAEVANLRLSFVSFLEKLPDKSYLAAFKDAPFEEAPQPGSEPLTFAVFVEQLKNLEKESIVIEELSALLTKLALDDNSDEASTEISNSGLRRVRRVEPPKRPARAVLAGRQVSGGTTKS